MRGKKVYGKSGNNPCEFCNSFATTKNKQGLPTCFEHKDKSQETKRCICGDYVDMKKSKYGMFYVCPRCGPTKHLMEENLQGNINSHLTKTGKPKDSETKRKDEKLNLICRETGIKSWKDL